MLFISDVKTFLSYVRSSKLFEELIYLYTLFSKNKTTGKAGWKVVQFKKTDDYLQLIQQKKINQYNNNQQEKYPFEYYFYKEGSKEDYFVYDAKSIESLNKLFDN